MPVRLQFRLGHSSASGVARAIEPDYHPHVLRVTLVRGAWINIFLKIVSLLPLAIQAFARTVWPAFFLPDVVVVKKLKPDWDDEFKTEKYMYKKLEPLQGHMIPIYYGEGQCEGTRALILSEVRGINAIEQENPCLHHREFARRLTVACGEMARYGLVSDDPCLWNLILVEDRIVFVDLEMWYEVEPEEVDTYSGFSIERYREEYGTYLERMEGGW